MIEIIESLTRINFYMILWELKMISSNVRIIKRKLRYSKYLWKTGMWFWTMISYELPDLSPCETSIAINKKITKIREMRVGMEGFHIVYICIAKPKPSSVCTSLESKREIIAET